MNQLSTFSIKCILFVIALIPMMIMVFSALTDSLGPNPVETLAQSSGIWSLRFLLISIAVTPVRLIFNAPGIVKYRRMLGLFAFFYCSVHLFIYIGLEHAFTWQLIKEDLLISPIAIVGLLAYLMMIPLSVTSTNGMMKKLGKRWKKLHSAVYIIGLLAILHFTLTVKADITQPLIYGSILLALLVIRGIRKNKPAVSNKS